MQQSRTTDTTEAIVLALQPHSDRAHILHTYTRAHGRANYMVYGLGKKKSGALYAPLSIIELTLDEHTNRPIQTVKQASLNYAAPQTDSDPRRQAIALFVAEVLYRVLKHPMEDESMYNMVRSTVEAINEATHPENIHLMFLRGLATEMGVGINPDEHTSLYTEPSSRRERQQQLKDLCHYLQTHLDDWQEPKSMDILMQLFD